MRLYFTATIENIANKGVVKINSLSTGDPPGTVNRVRIKRKLPGSVTLTTLRDIAITQASDFTFAFEDNQCRSGATYDYQIIPVDSEDTELVGQTLTVKSEFYGIYIADDTAEWFCDLNPVYDYDINTLVGYIKPLKGKYPIRVTNGDTRYAYGSVQGLFLPRDASGCYADIISILAAARKRKAVLLDFLCNQETKLLKTYDGHVWYVGIDANPKEVVGRVIGTSEIKFGWTEIADPPEV